MDRTTITVFTISISMGALIWFLSPMLTGHLEPWDSRISYYVVSLFLSGSILGLFVRRRFWIVPCGVVVGQLFYMLLLSLLHSGPLVVLGVFYLIGSSLLVVLGLVCSWIVRSRFSS